MSVALQRAYESRIEGGGVRGRPPVKWINSGRVVARKWAGKGWSVLRGSD